jgi:hypothetical protein
MTIICEQQWNEAANNAALGAATETGANEPAGRSGQRCCLPHKYFCFLKYEYSVVEMSSMHMQMTVNGSKSRNVITSASNWKGTCEDKDRTMHTEQYQPQQQMEQHVSMK